MRKFYKHLQIVITLFTVMLLFPVAAIKLAPENFGMSICFILFFVVNPLTVIEVSVIAGTEIKKLWWAPLAAAISFFLFFSLAILEIVAELLIYSAFYLFIGSAAMLLTAFITRKRN